MMKLREVLAKGGRNRVAQVAYKNLPFTVRTGPLVEQRKRILYNFFSLMGKTSYLNDLAKEFLMQSDLTQKEIAEKLSVSTSYLANRVYDANQKYKKDFEMGLWEILADVRTTEKQLDDLNNKVLELISQYDKKGKITGLDEVFVVPLDLGSHDFKPKGMVVDTKVWNQVLILLQNNVLDRIKKKVEVIPEEYREYVIYLLTVDEGMLEERELKEKQDLLEVLWLT